MQKNAICYLVSMYPVEKNKIKAMFISKIVVFPQSTTPSLLEYSKL